MTQFPLFDETELMEALNADNRFDYEVFFLYLDDLLYIKFIHINVQIRTFTCKNIIEYIIYKYRSLELKIRRNLI